MRKQRCVTKRLEEIILIDSADIEVTPCSPPPCEMPVASYVPLSGFGRPIDEKSDALLKEFRRNQTD